MKFFVIIALLALVIGGGYVWHRYDAQQRQLAGQQVAMDAAYNREHIAELEVQVALQDEEIATREGRRPNVAATQRAKMHLADAKLEVLMQQDRTNLQTMLASH